jgi:hypothetical protein
MTIVLLDCSGTNVIKHPIYIKCINLINNYNDKIKFICENIYKINIYDLIRFNIKILIL